MENMVENKMKKGSMSLTLSGCLQPSVYLGGVEICLATEISADQYPNNAKAKRKRGKNTKFY